VTSADTDGPAGAEEEFLSPAAHIAETSRHDILPHKLNRQLTGIAKEFKHGRLQSLLQQWEARAADVAAVCSQHRAASDAAIGAAHPWVATVLRQTGPGGANVYGLDAAMALTGEQDRPAADLLRGFQLVGELPITHAATVLPIATAVATVAPADFLGLPPRTDPGFDRPSKAPAPSGPTLKWRPPSGSRPKPTSKPA